MRTTEKMAEAFRRGIRGALTSSELRLVDGMNEGTDDRTCATHNFCDANVYMAEAFEATVGREPDTSEQGDVAMWNSAWDMALRAGFAS